MMITALVVDDEPIARRAITRLLRDDADITLLNECGDGAAAIQVIHDLYPDVVFLDVQMPIMTGMEVASLIKPESMPAIVFVTAYEQYAVRAFDANAVDYLVKPFGRDRFAQTLCRIKRRLSGEKADKDGYSAHVLQALSDLQQRDNYIDRLPVRADEHVVLVKVDEIIWIKASGNTVLIHLPERSYVLRETMSSLSRRLNPRHFMRVHRSAIINVRRAKTIEPWFNGYHVVTMDTGQKLRMSRYQREAFIQLVSNQRKGQERPGPAGA